MSSQSLTYVFADIGKKYIAILAYGQVSEDIFRKWKNGETAYPGGHTVEYTWHGEGAGRVKRKETGRNCWLWGYHALRQLRKEKDWPGVLQLRDGEYFIPLATELDYDRQSSYDVIVTWPAEDETPDLTQVREKVQAAIVEARKQLGLEPQQK